MSTRCRGTWLRSIAKSLEAQSLFFNIIFNLVLLHNPTQLQNTFVLFYGCNFLFFCKLSSIGIIKCTTTVSGFVYYRWEQNNDVITHLWIVYSYLPDDFSRSALNMRIFFIFHLLLYLSLWKLLINQNSDIWWNFIV